MTITKPSAQIIDINDIDPLVLPALSFKDFRQLPKIPAIYFCLTPEDIIVYIGQTSNLYTRWNGQHDKKLDCKRCKCNRISWLAPVPSQQYDRLSIERLLIRKYEPFLNSQVWKRFAISSVTYRKVILPKYRELAKRLGVNLDITFDEE